MLPCQRIDVHHHMATEYLPVFDIAHGADMIWWSLEAAIRMMDENEIRMAILSSFPKPPDKPLREAMRHGVRSTNEEAAAIARLMPDRFSFFAPINLLNAEDAIVEASYALDTLGAAGIFMPTNIREVYLGDPVFEPLFAELNRRRAVVFVHPLHLPCPLVPGIPGHVIDFLHSTVRAATNLVQKGVMQRYAQIKFILCHGGGYIPYAVQRFSRILAATYPKRSAAEYLEDYRKFYFDTALATAPAALSALLALAQPDHVLYGSDFPFSQPNEVSFFTRQFDGLDLDGELRCAINSANALALLPILNRRMDGASSTT
jgi:predicted TIM-barrel fold metal-dependent hydrolase